MLDARVLCVAASLPLVLAIGCDHAAGVPQAVAQTTSSEKVRANTAAMRPEPVLAGSPSRKTLTLTTTQPGRIEAFETAPLYGKVSGFVSEVRVDIGDEVEKGETLVKIAVPELEDERRQKQALVAQAKAQVGQSQAALRAAQAGVASSQAAVEQAKATVERTEAEFERWRAESTRLDALAASGSVTQKVADEIRNQFRAADAARRETAAGIHSSEAALAEADARVEQAKADVVAAEARLNVTEADLARAQTMLGYTEIKAPFAGVVTRRSVDSGHFVPQGGTGGSLLSVVRADRVRVFLEVPEIEAVKVDIGDPATVHVQAHGGEPFAGAVTRTAWAFDTANRTLSTEIDLDNAQGRLRPGMYATAAIELDKSEHTLTLPITAIARRPEGTFCFVIRNGRATRTPITLGLRVGNDWEVTAGVAEADTVALAKAETLQDGQAVEPIAPTP